MAKKYSTAEAAAINSKFGEDTKYKVQNGVLKIKQAMTAREKAEQPTNKKGYVWGTSIGKEPSGVTSALMSKQRTVKTRSGDSAVTAGKQRTVKTRAGGSTDTGKQRTVKTREGGSAVTGKQRTVKTREGGSTDTGKQRTVKTREGGSTDTGKQRTVKTRAGKGSVKSPASSSQRTVKTRAGKKKPLAPTTSVRPIARTTAADPKKEQGYFVDKKKGNAMVRVFPNDVSGGWDSMTNAERKAKGYPTSDSKKYSIDYNQRNVLTFIIKK